MANADHGGILIASEFPSAAWLSSRRLQHRLDASYYSAIYLPLDSQLDEKPKDTVVPLRELLKSPRRVLYQNTASYDRTEKPPLAVPFISGVDLDSTTLSVNWDSVRFVDKWMADQYPRGLLFPGSLLIKVKGPNQSAVFVERFREQALVSGTIFFAGVKGADPYYLAAYLASETGTRWRTRLRTNITVEFVGNDELKEVPIYLPDEALQRAISNKIRKAERLRDLEEAANESFARWLSDASHSSVLTAADRCFLEHSPDATCTGGTWIANVDTADRIDPWPYHTAPRVIRSHLEEVAKASPLSEFLNVVSGERESVSSSSLGEGQYHISVVDVDASGAINWDKALTTRYDGSGVRVVPGDILYSCLNPKEARACVLPNESRGQMIASMEFSVLRPTAGREPVSDLIVAVLRSNWVRVQASFLTRSSSLSRRRLQEEDLLKVLIPWSNQQTEEISKLMATATGAREEAGRLVAQAKADVERLIVGTLDEDRLLAESTEIETWLRKNPSPHPTARTHGEPSEM